MRAAPPTSDIRDDSHPTGRMPAFTYALAKKQRPSLEWTNKTFMVDYRSRDPKSGKSTEYTADEILHFAKSSQAGTDRWVQNLGLKGKIVILSGDFGAQDEHETPMGWRNGGEILKSIIETELRGGGTVAPQRWILFVMAAITACVVYLMFQLLPMKPAILVTLFGAPVLATIAARIAFGSVAQAAFFLPMLLVVVGQQSYKRFEQARKSRTELSRRAA